MTFLYCADPLNPRKVDSHFAAEAALVRELGGTVIKGDHDDLMRAKVPQLPAANLIYRGWMMPSTNYAAMAAAFAVNGVALVTTADQYRKAHELPGWYDDLSPVTPASVWISTPPQTIPTQSQIEALTAQLPAGAAIVKDFVKSRKHEWHEACFVPELSDTANVQKIIGRMIELQEDSLQGGVVIRTYEKLHRPEVRVWWVDGNPVLTTAHPDTPGQTAAPDLTEIRPLILALSLPFITSDLAMTDSGRWRLVEIGDGQVSDLPPDIDSQALFSALVLRA